MRFRFSKWACDQLTEQCKKIIISDEAHFEIGGYVNKRNCRIGAQKTGTHTQKSRRTQNEWLFGAVLAIGIIGPFFFENEQGAMLTQFLFTKIEEEDIGNIWFQQDAATSHTAEATLDVLRPFLKTALSAAELMLFGQLGAAIWHHWRIVWYRQR